MAMRKQPFFSLSAAPMHLSAARLLADADRWTLHIGLLEGRSRRVQGRANESSCLLAQPAVVFDQRRRLKHVSNLAIDCLA